MYSLKLPVTFAVVGLALISVPASVSASGVDDKSLVAIAVSAMTPAPAALRTQGTVSEDVKTDTDPVRGLDLCEDGLGVGRYAPTPVSSIKSMRDVKASDGLSETTVDISLYPSKAKAQAAWQKVVRVLTKRCSGVVLAPKTSRTLPDGQEVIWASLEFNEVTTGRDAGGTVGVSTTFQNTLYDSNAPSTVVSSWVVQQYSSWKLVGKAIVRAEFARLWNPSTSAPAIDPVSPAVTGRMQLAVDAMTHKAALAIDKA